MNIIDAMKDPGNKTSAHDVSSCPSIIPNNTDNPVGKAQKNDDVINTNVDNPAIESQNHTTFAWCPICPIHGPPKKNVSEPKKKMLKIAERANDKEDLYDVLYKTMCKHMHFYTQNGEIVEQKKGSKKSYRRICKTDEYLSGVIVADGITKHLNIPKHILDMFFTKKIFNSPTEKNLPYVHLDGFYIELEDCFYNILTCCFQNDLPKEHGTDIYCPKMSSKNYIAILKMYNYNNSYIMNELKSAFENQSRKVMKDIMKKLNTVDRTFNFQTPSICLVLMDMFSVKFFDRKIYNEVPAAIMILSLRAKDYCALPCNMAVIGGTKIRRVEWDNSYEQEDMLEFQDPLDVCDEDRACTNCTSKFINLQV